jgi:hypothetical protein
MTQKKISLPTNELLAFVAKERLRANQSISVELFVALTLARCENPAVDAKAKQKFNDKFLCEFKKLKQLLKLSEIETLKPKFKTH